MKVWPPPKKKVQSNMTFETPNIIPICCQFKPWQKQKLYKAFLSLEGEVRGHMWHILNLYMLHFICDTHTYLFHYDFQSLPLWRIFLFFFLYTLNHQFIEFCRHSFMHRSVKSPTTAFQSGWDLDFDWLIATP